MNETVNTHHDNNAESEVATVLFYFHLQVTYQEHILDTQKHVDSEGFITEIMTLFRDHKDSDLYQHLEDDSRYNKHDSQTLT